MTDRNMKCPYCGTETIGNSRENLTYTFVDCPACGSFEYQNYPDTIGANIKDKIASYLYYTSSAERKKDDRFYNFIGSTEYFEKEHSNYSFSHYVSLDEIEAFYPKTFAERIDRILLEMAKKSDFFGDKISFSKEQLISAFFLRRYSNDSQELDKKIIDFQLSETVSYLENNEYIEIFSNSNNNYIFVIKPNGYKRIDELQIKEAEESKNVFIAMSFAEDMKEVRKSIKNAVLENGYIPRIMDEIEHNHQIVPEMLYEIRQAKFVVAELTGHNNGAYFEAGYALGQGKEVIQICSKKCFGTDGHFDVKQINTILWDTTEELFQRLSARIKATIK